MHCLAHAVVLCFCWTPITCTLMSTFLPSPPALYLGKADSSWTASMDSCAFQLPHRFSQWCTGRGLEGGVGGKFAIHSHNTPLTREPSVGGCPLFQSPQLLSSALSGSGKPTLPLPLQAEGGQVFPGCWSRGSALSFVLPNSINNP